MSTLTGESGESACVLIGEPFVLTILHNMVKLCRDSGRLHVCVAREFSQALWVTNLGRVHFFSLGKVISNHCRDVVHDLG